MTLADARWALTLATCLCLAACSSTPQPGDHDGGTGGPTDLGPTDAAPDLPLDLGPGDAAPDLPLPVDLGPGDAAPDLPLPVDLGPPDAASASGLDALLTESEWAAMFPNRNALYDFASLRAAAATFPAFLSEGSADDRKRELAAFLANIAHETTGGWDAAPGGRYAWGLYFTQEVGCESGGCTGYCAPSATYPCEPGKTYHGRGPIQLSWNYNYGQAGDALGLPLLTMPELVTSSGEVAFRTALWFWMTPQAPKPSCHDVMTGGFVPDSTDVAEGRLPGFGMTVLIINGGLECNRPTPPAVSDRLGFYDRFTTALGVSPGSNLDCATMQAF